MHRDDSTPEENHYVPIPMERLKGGSGYSGNAFFSHDNRYIAFESSADNLLNDPKSDTNNSVDVFIKDLQTGDIKLVSQISSEVQANENSTITGFTADGNNVSFTSYASSIDKDGDDGMSLFLSPRDTKSRI